MNKNTSLFTSVPQQKISRNLFDLSHEVKSTYKFGYLYPMLLMDVVPGDTIRDQLTVMARTAPLLSPVMHRIDVSTHFFFVPNRILTDHWEDFITGGQDGTSTAALPYITPAGIYSAGGYAHISDVSESLWDYFGLPMAPTPQPTVVSTEQISVLPFKAYCKIFNDFYRDPNVDAEVDIDTEITGDVSAAWYGKLWYSLRQRGWAKDYFTSALPWAQRGAEVLMPLGGTGVVTYKDGANQELLFNSDGTDMVTGGNLQAIPSGFGGISGGFVRNTGETKPVNIENIESVTFENSSITINDFRRSLAIQRWLENNARGGGRYVEQIMSHFNVRVPDYRLQRAEYLGGGKQPVVISEVLATAGADDQPPVGDMKGHGISVGKSNRFTYRCQEHGWIIGIISIMPVGSYDLGIERMWQRPLKYDYAWPELARLGEQQILSKELFFDFDQASPNNDTFGYIPRYSEYKFKNDRFTGLFRTSLAFWHLGRIFTSRPQLDNQFLKMDEDNDDEETSRRIFAVQDGTDYIWVQMFHRLTAKRPLPYFGVPSIM